VHGCAHARRRAERRKKGQEKWGEAKLYSLLPPVGHSWTGLSWVLLGSRDGNPAELLLSREEEEVLGAGLQRAVANSAWAGHSLLSSALQGTTPQCIFLCRAAKITRK
jgi:hypothetical protein